MLAPSHDAYLLLCAASLVALLLFAQARRMASAIEWRLPYVPQGWRAAGGAD